MIDINGSVNRKDLDKTKSSAHFSQIGYLANRFFLIQMWKSYASWRVAPSNFVWLLAEIIPDAVQVSMDQNEHHTMKARRNHQVTGIHRVMSLIGLLLSTMSLSGCGSLMLNSHLASSSESVIAMRVEENHIGLNPSSFSFAGSSTASNHVSCGDKEHVYIFLINGLDLLHYADMPGLAQHLRSLGYCRVYYSELLTANSLVEEIQQVARQDSQARFVLIGYSFGANWARNIAHTLADQGIAIDLLVYLNANTLRNTPYDRPENAQRVINILAWGVLLDGDHLDNAENIEITDAWHFNTPMHPHTLRILEQELARLHDPRPITTPK